MRVLVIDVPNKPHAQAGQVLDLPEAEAKDMLARGAAVAAPDEPPAELPGEPEPADEPEIAVAHDEPAAKPKNPKRTKRLKKR